MTSESLLETDAVISDTSYLLEKINRGVSNLADPGEISVIALTKELPDYLLILDDSKARKVAESLDP